MGKTINEIVDEQYDFITDNEDAADLNQDDYITYLRGLADKIQETIRSQKS